jgi:hypothetical protein
LKSRGVTRYLDLDKANRQNLLDIEDEDVGMHSDPEILAPPLQRRRLGPVDEPVLPPLPDVMPEDFRRSLRVQRPTWSLRTSSPWRLTTRATTSCRCLLLFLLKLNYLNLLNITNKLYFL